MPILNQTQTQVRNTIIYNNKVWGVREGDWVFLEKVEEKSKDSYLEAIGCERFLEGEDVLFNLRDDPMQRKNILAQHPEVVKRLRSELQEAQKHSYLYLE